MSILLAILLILYKIESEKEYKRLSAIGEQQKLEREQYESNLEKQMKEYSFYQKLKQGLDVNILIVGDSIGAGAGVETQGNAWYDQLSSYLRTTYDGRVTFTNISMGGNTSYAGYVRVAKLDDDINYDLAILCYGQNDNIDDFSLQYEALIRIIMNKYQNCSIISILESSQREYTEKMIAIQNLAKHYNIELADTIESFSIFYDDLSNDGIHPNDKGQDVYFNVLKNVIIENVKNETCKIFNADIVNKQVVKFENYKIYDVNNDDFIKISDREYALKTSISGIMGIDYTYTQGDNNANIYIDGELYKSPMRSFDYDFSQRHILIVSEDCNVQNEIRIVFETPEQADGFQGIIFSWE